MKSIKRVPVLDKKNGLSIHTGSLGTSTIANLVIFQKLQASCHHKYFWIREKGKCTFSEPIKIMNIFLE